MLSHRKNETTAEFLVRFQAVIDRKAALIKALEATIKNPSKEK